MNNQKPRGLSAQDLGLALVMNIMWGLNLIAVKVGVEMVSPLTAAWLRHMGDSVNTTATVTTSQTSTGNRDGLVRASASEGDPD